MNADRAMSTLERLHLTRIPTITSQMAGSIDQLRNDVRWTMHEAEFADLAQRVFPDAFAYLDEYRGILSEPYYTGQERRRPDSKYSLDPFGWRFTLVKMFSELVHDRPMFIEVDGARFRVVREVSSSVHIDRIDSVVYELAPLTENTEV